MRPIAHGFCTMASNRLELVNKNPHDWQIQFKSGCMIQTWKSIPEVCHVCMVGSLSAVEGSSSVSRQYSKSYIQRDGGSTRVPTTGPAVLSVEAIGMSQGQGLNTLWNLKGAPNENNANPSMISFCHACQSCHRSIHTIDMVPFVDHRKPLVRCLPS